MTGIWLTRSLDFDANGLSRSTTFQANVFSPE
jgi:hypothetical protein